MRTYSRLAADMRHVTPPTFSRRKVFFFFLLHLSLRVYVCVEKKTVNGDSVHKFKTRGRTRFPLLFSEEREEVHLG